MENKKDYLKKYLNEKPKKKKKVKVKKPVVSNPRFKIIDDDINVKSLAEDFEEEEVGEEAPQIVEIIDESRKPRWKTLGDDTGNVLRKRLDSDSDQSPPRTLSDIQQNSENFHKSRFDSDSDQSPPRPNQNNLKDSDDDLSPLRNNKISARKKYDSDNEHSLSKSHSNRKHSKISQEKQPERSDSDVSRSSHKKHKKKHKKHSKQNLSPQKRERLDSDSDQSSIRYSSNQENYKNKKKKYDSDSDENKQYASKNHKHSNIKEHERRIDRFYKSDNEKLDKKFKNEIGKKAKHSSNIEAELSDKGNEESRKKEVPDTGLDENNKTEMEIPQEPFARYKDDPELEDHLKSQLRDGDPMLSYIKKKKSKNQTESTEKVQVYKGPPPPPNRFNISPGYRWDGVDRSNGFEKKHFEIQAQKKAFEELAYKWSVEDM